MKALREKVCQMCEQLGYKAARKWNKPRMAEKLKEIAELAKTDGLEIEDDEELNDLLKKVIATGGEVQVVRDMGDEDDGAAADETAKASESEPATEVDKTESTKTPKDNKPAKASKEKKDKPAKEKKDKPAKEKKAPVKTGNRLSSAFQTVKAVDSAVSMDDLVAKANKAHMANGGKDNLKESNWAVKIAVQAGEEFGLIKIDGKNVVPVNGD